jgi:hypothetical protein
MDETIGSHHQELDTQLILDQTNVKDNKLN